MRFLRMAALASAAGLTAFALFSVPARAASQAQTKSSAERLMRVSADVLNVRTGPSAGAPVRKKLYRGEEVRASDLGNGWCRIRLDGVDCYVSGEYLSGEASSSPASGALPAGVTVEEIALSDGLRFAEFSKIRGGRGRLYRNAAGARGEIVVGVNAGHGTRGGGSVKTQSHPDGSGKVTGGTNGKGAVYSLAVSSGMEFLDGTPEHVVTLQEAKILRDKLLARGYSVLMLRDGEDVQLDNIARTVLANGYANCHVAIHWDSSSSDKGAFFMSVPDALKGMEPVSSTWRESEALGSALIGGLKGRGAKIMGEGSMDMDLTQTSYSSVPSVDIELGDKASDHGRAALELLAEGLADGIEQYFRQKSE